MSLEKEANVFADIIRDELGNYHNIFLIGHSIGGIPCKAVITQLICDERLDLIDRIAGLFLLASPQLGSLRVPRILSRFSADAEVLKAHAPLLVNIARTFEDKVLVNLSSVSRFAIYKFGPRAASMITKSLLGDTIRSHSPHMLRNLHLTALRAFEAATRTGSFRLAADDLGLTPSAVSHAIRGLEQDLGTVLFEREGRSIRLTPEGETLMRHVERGFGELHLGLSSVAARKPQLLKLHCAPSFAAQWLVPRLRKLLAECSGLELRLATGTDYTKFLADEFDADIVYGVPATDYYGTLKQQGLIVLPLGTEVVTPLCAPSLAPEIRSPSDLLKQTLIESDNKKVRWPAWFAANGLVAPLPNGPRFDRSFMSLSAAADEIGVALESTLLAEREISSGRLVRPLQGISEDVVYTGHWLVFPRSKRFARSMVTFISWLTKQLGLDINLATLDEVTSGQMSTPVLRTKAPLVDR